MSRYGEWDGTSFGVFVGRVEDALKDPSVRFLIGRNELHTNAPTRRVVWTTSPSPVSQPKTVGGKLFPDESEEDQETPKQMVRSNEIYSLETNATAHVFAESGAMTERLFGNLLVIMRRTFGSKVFAPRTFAWMTDQEGEPGGRTKRQPKMTLDFIARARVNDELSPLTTVTDVLVNFDDQFLEPILP